MKKKIIRIALPVAVVAVIAACLLGHHVAGNKVDRTEVITVSALERIVNASDLSTCMTTYRGVAQVMNQNKPEDTDYYVSYEATIKAGLDFTKIDISMDDENKTIRATLPEVHIISTDVDITSLDFIFYNKKANTSTVTQAAYEACQADVQKECEEQEAILVFAKQNAVNVVTALMRPIVEELGAEYTLVVE